MSYWSQIWRSQVAATRWFVGSSAKWKSWASCSRDIQNFKMVRTGPFKHGVCATTRNGHPCSWPWLQETQTHWWVTGINTTLKHWNKYKEKERTDLVLGGRGEPGNKAGWMGENFITLSLFFPSHFSQWVWNWKFIVGVTAVYQVFSHSPGE